MKKPVNSLQREAILIYSWKTRISGDKGGKFNLSNGKKYCRRVKLTKISWRCSQGNPSVIIFRHDTPFFHKCYHVCCVIIIIIIIIIITVIIVIIIIIIINFINVS